MLTSRRSVVAAGAAAAASLASGASAKAPATPEANEIDQAVAELIRRSEEANAALMRGDVARYRALVTLSDDFTLMSPFGGAPSRSARLTDEGWEEVGRFFRNGTLTQELIEAYGTADMAVLAIIEHGHGEVGGLPAQDWPLRVTLVYRRDGSEWRLTHRHADPLARGVTLEEAAALAA